MFFKMGLDWTALISTNCWREVFIGLLLELERGSLGRNAEGLGNQSTRIR